jgi:CheY-like chemotaxis protein
VNRLPPHSVADLLTAIASCTDRLITSLDDEHPALAEAMEIRRLVAAAARITRLRHVLDHSAAVGPTGAATPTSGTPPTSDTVPLEGTLVASVLVVEDEPRIRELIRVVLTRAGHDVVAVAGPHEALAVLQRRPTIEVLLTDVIMPDMTGYDLADQARARLPAIRVIFTSGFARDAARHSAADGFLPKPFTFDALTAVVQQALRIG